ncbi:kinase-like protein [Sporormia fimetaria CBS 119925]|uniref:dual-specificity kinase n=1 Tax=Sporormia fimetaria CBS 119925 TaxID=1340428 RepID=A0A6A6VFW2_9PLEO|nr:kinase-like protein [Sporormia fimetaria CBS 119925]
MSTPSTATATLAPHHQNYHHQRTYTNIVDGKTYVTNGPLVGGFTYHSFGPGTSTSDLRRTATNHARPAPQLPAPAPASPLEDMADERRSQGKRNNPNWAEFYKNGIPKEVIVIDDDDDDAPAPPPSRHTQPSRNGAPTATNTNGTVRHTDKKRKTATTTAYDPVYSQQLSYSTTQTPYVESPHSIDRTTSTKHTTASNSLGSRGGNAVPIAPLDGSVVGQKRKRTRAAAQDEAKEAKRRELDTSDDHPFSLYQPPPNPVIKAKDVVVKVEKDHSSTKDQQVDDEDGHYIVNVDADLTERYTILKLLGQGTFGKVVEAYDKRKGTKCAIKIIRSVPKYRDASRIELRVLATLAANDKYNANRCIHFRECFDFRNHICIVTDLYGQSVFDFLKANQFVPFPSTHIQKFAKQLFTSVAFLHDLNLIHTDLKPENILLVNSSYQTFTYNRTVPSSSTTVARTARHRRVLLDPEIRLIDFGSATFNDEYHSSVVSTRHYRAPEIILNLGWSFPCDIWSIGCILVEFFTGDALFQTHDNLEHLAMMEAVCGGKLDREIVKQVYKNDKGSRNSASSCARSYFKQYRLNYPNGETPSGSRKYVRAMKKLHETIPPLTEFNRQFLDLLTRIFVYDPKKRITAKEALHHPWFKESLNDDGTEAHKIRLSREAKVREQQEAERRREEAERRRAETERRYEREQKGDQRRYQRERAY